MCIKLHYTIKQAMKFTVSFSFIFLTIIELTVLGDDVGRRTLSSRIYRGYPINITDAPWMAVVRYHKAYSDAMCGGTIVNEMFILTAGHCVIDDLNNKYQTRKADRFEIRVSATNSDKGGTLYEVAEVYPHPGYTPDTRFNDIGLLKLTKKIVYDKATVQNVQLDTSNGIYKGGEDVWAMGWGRNPQNIESSDLYEVQLGIVDAAKCAKKWDGSVSEYRKHVICAIGPKDASVCSGDSGGPLLYGENIQIGVASFANECGEDKNKKHLPAAFTKIADYMDWINGIISKKHHEEEDGDDDC